MQATSGISARRAWLEAERRAIPLSGPSEGPTFAQTFLSGFMRGSLLQMAVCSPPRQAMTKRVDAVFIARIGDRVDARGKEVAAVR